MVRLGSGLSVGDPPAGRAFPAVADRSRPAVIGVLLDFERHLLRVPIGGSLAMLVPAGARREAHLCGLLAVRRRN